MVKAPGYSDAETTVTIRPLLTADTAVTMVETGEGGPGIDGKLIGGIAGLAVGAASLGVGIWGMTQVDAVRNDPVFDAWKREPQNQTADDVCTVTEPAPSMEISNMCSQAKTGEIAQLVAFPLAAVAGGVGAYLLATSSIASDGDDEAPASAFTVTPIITPQTQAVTLTYSF